MATQTQNQAQHEATYIKGTTLQWPAVWQSLGFAKGRAGRWHPGDDTPGWVTDYVRQFRSPSRAWPQSYAKPCLSQKFARMLCQNEPEMAMRMGVGK